MIDGFEPMTIFSPSGMYGSAVPAVRADSAVRGCTRGAVGRVGTGWVYWEGYTGTHPGPSQETILSLFLPQGPTYGQMKLILEYL